MLLAEWMFSIAIVNIYSALDIHDLSKSDKYKCLNWIEFLFLLSLIVVWRVILIRLIWILIIIFTYCSNKSLELIKSTTQLMQPHFCRPNLTVLVKCQSPRITNQSNEASPHGKLHRHRSMHALIFLWTTAGIGN